MTPSRRVSLGVRALLRWVGQACALCGSESGSELLCSRCHTDLPALPDGCPRCALPTSGGALCGACLRDPPYFESTIALWRYEFPADRLLHELKYRGRLALADFFGLGLAARPLPEVDIFVPMPLHPRRLRERGFNQALEIARVLARHTRWPLAPHRVHRIRDTPPQTGLALGDRRGNVRGAFRTDADLLGLRVGVVDDVMTTGATLNELAHALKRAGATQVHNFVVARTVFR